MVILDALRVLPDRFSPSLHSALMLFKQNSTKPQFPFWQFLDQPLFDPTRKLVLNPRRFWQMYQIQMLERCWAQDCESGGHRRS